MFERLARLEERGLGMVIQKRREDEQRDKKLMWLLGGLVACLLVLWILFAPGRGLLSYLQLRREVATLSEENSHLLSKMVAMNAEMERLKSDNAYLEQVARKNGMLKKDEMVFDFSKPPKKK